MGHPVCFYPITPPPKLYKFPSVKRKGFKYILYWNEAYDSKGEFFFFYILKTFDFMQLMQHIMFSYLHLQIDLGFRSRRASVSQSVSQSVRNPR